MFLGFALNIPNCHMKGKTTCSTRKQSSLRDPESPRETIPSKKGYEIRSKTKQNIDTTIEMALPLEKG